MWFDVVWELMSKNSFVRAFSKNGFLLVSLTDTLDTMEHVRTTYSTIVQVFHLWAKTF